MAYNDTQSLRIAKQKAVKLGATHFFNYVLHETGEIFSTYFVNGDQPDSKGMLKELAGYSHNMKSFNIFERDQPFKNLNDKRTGYTHLIKIPPVYKVPSFNCCK